MSVVVGTSALHCLDAIAIRIKNPLAVRDGALAVTGVKEGPFFYGRDVLHKSIGDVLRRVLADVNYCVISHLCSPRKVAELVTVLRFAQLGKASVMA
jgi:hypothetical protein